MSSKRRVKKQFNSTVNVIDFQQHQTPLQKKKRVILQARNRNQEAYLDMLQDDSTSIVFAVGPAGTGKTMMAVTHGIKLLQEGVIEKIVITRPAVSVDEDLGFLPGTLNEKMQPWCRPIFDVFHEYYDQKTIEEYLYEGIIEIAPLSFMRGRSFKHAYIIADEAQLATTNQIKMLLTRIGEGCKMVVTGDLAQSDRGNDNGLRDFLHRVEGYNCQHIDIAYFDHKDIERHRAVKEVLSIYGDE